MGILGLLVCWAVGVNLLWTIFMLIEIVLFRPFIVRVEVSKALSMNFSSKTLSNGSLTCDSSWFSAP